MNAENDRARAYRVGSTMARERIEREAPLDAEALRRVQAADILVVPGGYDRVEQVLDALGTPYTPVSPMALDRARLRPDQLVVVNCPGHLERGVVEKLRTFVSAGGSLFTTDWALLHVLEPAFPGVVAYNHRATADEVVRIEVRSRDNPFLAGVMDGRDDPVWWLEGSSYPIRILDPGRVEVLLASRELAERYGEEPVALTFREGEGEVLHMISHYYLQRTELRTARHAAPAPEYFAEKKMNMSPRTAREAEGLSVGDVESAATSARFLANILAKKKRRSERR